LHPCHLPAPGQPLSSLHAALHPLDIRRLHHRLSGLGWRAGGRDRRAGDARLPLRLRRRQSGARRRRGDVGPAGADPHSDPVDAPAPDERGAVVSIALPVPHPARRRRRLRRNLTEAGTAVLGILLLIWSLTPVYQMFLIALDPEEGEIEFTGNIWPSEISIDGFRDVVTQEARYLEDFWLRFGNSLFIGL